jgi:hypothetical protein
MPTLLDQFDPAYDPEASFGSGLYSGNPSALTTQRDAKLMSNVGMFTAIMGGINSAIGSFYAAKTAQYQMKSTALNYQFQSDMAAINARSAENDAQTILEAGKSEVQQYTLRAGQEKAAQTASTAGRGVVVGVGSARDVSASQDLVKNIDVMTINSNAVRAAYAQRVRATNYQNQSLLYRTSANNARRSADSVSPFASMSTSLLGSASAISSQWLANRDTRT